MKNPLWMFYTNYNLHKPIIMNDFAEWLIPIVFGFVMNSTTKFTQVNKVGYVKLLIRISLMELGKGIIGQFNLENITVAQCYQSVDLFVGLDEKIAKIAFLFTSGADNAS